jgi:HEPN domain-containing protein
MTEKLYENWLNFAFDDLRSAEILMAAGIYNMVCFHAQQSAEKALKAVLAVLRQPIPRTHNLIRLRQMAEGALGFGVDIDLEALRFLNDVYLDSRYPQELGLLPEGLPNALEAQRALEEAQRIYAELKALIDRKIDP